MAVRVGQVQATDAQFRARLEPELTVSDLDTRAGKAAAVLAKAVGEGNDGLAGRALTRLLERWAEREALIAAPVWLWGRRADALEAVFSAIDDTHPSARAVTEAWYMTICRASGEDADTAGAHAYRMTQAWFRGAVAS